MPWTAVTSDSTPTECLKVLAFAMDDRNYGLSLPQVRRVVRAVEITPLPDAPDTVLGIVNVHGRIVTVLDLRKRFRLPPREISPGDHFVIARAKQREVILVADSIRGVIERTVVVLSNVRYVQGVMQLEDGMILIHDLDTFLSAGEEAALDRALRKEPRES